MKRAILIGMTFLFSVILASCGGGSDPVPPMAVSIFSDTASDGDIAYDPVDVTYTYNYADITKSVWIGIDEGGTHIPEYAGILDFPLDGTTGGAVIPSTATIVSAEISLFVTSASYATTIPMVLDLMNISGSPSLDFGSTALLTRTPGLSFLSSDASNYVVIDITTLMQEAQRLALPRLQLRFLLDLSATRGLVVIEDDSAVASRRPQLSVRYTP